MNMSKAVLLALFLFAFSSRPGDGPGRAAAAPSSLWLKAVHIHRQNRHWYPERITVLSEVLNRRGQPTSVTQFFFSLRMGADGRLDTELARSLKNGEDTTLKMREKVRIRDPRQGEGPDNEDTYSVSISDSPFVSERQQSVAFQAGSEKRILYGRSCQRFDFSYRTTIVRKGRTEELIWNGMAWLEEESGLPVKLEFTLTPLPSHIHSLWTIYLFETSHPNRWVVKSIRIIGQGGFLFIKKQFRTTTTFSDYRLPPPKEAKP